MGCESYDVEETIIRFDEWDEDVGCLCTVNEDTSLCTKDIRSLALLGLAVVLLKRKKESGDFEKRNPRLLHFFHISQDLPKKQVEKICQIVASEKS